MTKIGFIGVGNMGSALARAVSLAENVSVYLYDTDIAKAKETAKDIGAEYAPIDSLVASSDFIFLAVKPNIIPSVLQEIAPLVKEKKSILVSMAAGVSLESIYESLGYSDIPAIRIMPNTPVSIGCGMTLFSPSVNVSETSEKEFLRIMKNSGELDRIPEKLIDAASALSGCGPAFVYMFIEALADGGVECGLPRDKALAYAVETVKGAALMVKETKRHPGELKDMVCSPGGSTIAGVHALEDGKFRGATINAVLSAYKKTLTLGKK